MAVLAVALLASVWIAREALTIQMERRIGTELQQEVLKFRRFAAGLNPETGKPFGSDIRAAFKAFLSTDVADEGETKIGFVSGEPYVRSRGVTPYRLDTDSRFVSTYGRVTAATRATFDTPAGLLDLLAVPVETGERVVGTYVIGIFRQTEQAKIGSVVRVVGAVGGTALAVASLLAWRLTRRILGPVDAVTDAARRISEHDLARRIPVTGRDEISRLAATFNDMLDRLESSFEAQRSFIDDAGHELRTPLTIIGGHLELLDADDAAEREQTLDLVTDEVDRMTRIVGDLLMLAKAERSDFLRFAPFDLASLTEQLFEKVRALADRRWRLDAVGRGEIDGDRQRITQAIVQFASNAVQHTDEGAEIGMGSRLDHDWVRLWVRDTGPGVAPEDRERIFARFARGTGSGRRSESAGLGLAIAKAIAIAHGGSVDLSSAPGAGATFTLVLPVRRSIRSSVAEVVPGSANGP